MSVSHQIVRGYSDGTASYNATETVTAGLALALDESIPGASTDLVVALAFDKTKLKAIRLWADRDMDVYTNAGSGGSFGLHIALKADSPYVWSVADGYFAVPFAANVTALYVTLASGAASILHVRAIVDPT